MTDYYGIGGWYRHSRGSVAEDFLSKSRACISTRTPPYNAMRRGFQETFFGVSEGDNIYLKSFFMLRNGERMLRIKAIGKVTNTKKNTEETEFGFCIRVEWDHYKPEGLRDVSIDSLKDNVNRSTRVYQETNPEVIRIIDELIREYRK